MLHPVTDRLEAELRARLPHATFRALEPRYTEEPRGRWRTADALVVAPDQLVAFPLAATRTRVSRRDGIDR